ncbi:4'-phosphopantetheinyl transferase family protein [Lignipirellula cremea]|uniref:4'-phosphopantetheinyl transferase n=1 Tax=Lignipirellula cremea TaxID=2528010 RepID=A0A518DL42_9BACT|nr:4'-phosphopantetheinyl transferase family protein [Lignipirellula cremea]QDU92553.1 4'-phosphopantetheinyl transferase [Lignipirellula cremea]
MTAPLRVVRYCASRRWTAGSLKPSAAWLAPGELRELELFRDPQRRQQWLQGRRLAKETLAALAGATSLAQIEILTRDAQGRGLAPQVQVQGRPSRWRLTLSHSTRGVLAAVVDRDRWQVGADLTDAADRSEHFRQLWFTPAEQAWLNAAPTVRTAQLWSLKEAIYKACNQGEPWTPRAIELQFNPATSPQCHYHGRPLLGLQGSVQTIDGQTAAVVYLPGPGDRSPAGQSVAAELCL